jgi:hypothetical protein
VPRVDFSENSFAILLDRHRLRSTELSGYTGRPVDCTSSTGLGRECLELAV